MRCRFLATLGPSVIISLTLTSSLSFTRRARGHHSDELVASQSATFDFLTPLVQQANDRPEALVFVYSLSSHTTQAAITQWSTGLAQLFSQLPGGAGPRYMFIGDLTAGEEDAEGTQG